MEERARVLMIYTGGTAGMRPGPKGYEPAEGYFADRLASYPQLHDSAEPRFTTFPSRRGLRVHYDLLEYDPLLDSVNLNVGHWARIAKDIEAHYYGYDAFVIVHGTDTMAYTASALSFMLSGLNKPVIFTGSQIPLCELRNDAHENLLGALGLAGHYLIPEVGLYFHHRLLRGNRATKTDASGLEAFDSPNLAPLANVAIDVDVDWKLVRPMPVGAKFEARVDLNPNVAALRLFPGMTRAVVENFLQPPLEGLVLETYGSGNAPHTDERILGPIREASKRGMVIVNVSQCPRGRVQPSYASGRALLDAGVVPGADMTAEAALTKLAYLLDSENRPQEVREKMTQSLRGELTEKGE